MRSARKYILIPEYAPLYAMRECFGNEHGPLKEPTPTPVDIIGKLPLKEPTPTPVDIIGKLLLQSGREKLTIYEVVKEGKGFSKPVQLTRQNYQLPYEQIAGLTQDTAPENGDSVMLPSDPANPVEPTIVDTDQEDKQEEPPIVPCGEVVQDAADAEIEKVLADPEMETGVAATESPAEETGDDTAEDSDEGEATDVVNTAPANPYAGMSKNQRKKARREEAVRKAAEDALKNVTL